MARPLLPMLAVAGAFAFLLAATPSTHAQHTCETATTITTDAFAASGRVHQPGASDYYRKWLLAGETFRAVAHGTIEGDLHFGYLTADLAAEDCDRRPNTWVGNPILAKVPATGFYYLSVHAHLSGGDYTLVTEDL